MLPINPLYPTPKKISNDSICFHNMDLHLHRLSNQCYKYNIRGKKGWIKQDRYYCMDYFYFGMWVYLYLLNMVWLRRKVGKFER